MVYNSVQPWTPKFSHNKQFAAYHRRFPAYISHLNISIREPCCEPSVAPWLNPLTTYPENDNWGGVRPRSLPLKNPTPRFRLAELIDSEENTLKHLTIEMPKRQSELAKLSMEIRGLRVPLVEPQSPQVSTDKKKRWSTLYRTSLRILIPKSCEFILLDASDLFLDRLTWSYTWPMLNVWDQSMYTRAQIARDSRRRGAFYSQALISILQKA